MNSRASIFPGALPPANAPRRWVPAPLLRLSAVFHCAGAVMLLLYPAHWLSIVLTLLANHGLMGLVGMWPRSRLIDANLVRLPPAAAQRGEVSLTFDDGPNPEVTPRVLELLDGYGAKASFFFAATQAAAHPELVQEVVRRGHSVENHSYSHSYAFAAYGWGRLRRDIERSQALIAGVSGRLPEFFRAPMGLRSPMLDPLLAQAGLRYVSWTRRGYDTVSGNAARVLERLTRGLRAGDVLLLHDGTVARTPQGEPVVLAVLPPLLQRLADQGLKSVTLPAACNGSR
jgi:peptidoglycan/xylan/chitin deacetylase (PgdA/CDA1 family)